MWQHECVEWRVDVLRRRIVVGLGSEKGTKHLLLVARSDCGIQKLGELLDVLLR
jgi:hypothetical protein